MLFQKFNLIINNIESSFAKSEYKDRVDYLKDLFGYTSSGKSSLNYIISEMDLYRDKLPEEDLKSYNKFIQDLKVIDMHLSSTSTISNLSSFIDNSLHPKSSEAKCKLTLPMVNELLFIKPKEEQYFDIESFIRTFNTVNPVRNNLLGYAVTVPTDSETVYLINNLKKYKEDKYSYPIFVQTVISKIEESEYSDMLKSPVVVIKEGSTFCDEHISDKLVANGVKVGTRQLLGNQGTLFILQSLSDNKSEEDEPIKKEVNSMRRISLDKPTKNEASPMKSISLDEPTKKKSVGKDVDLVESQKLVISKEDIKDVKPLSMSYDYDAEPKKSVKREHPQLQKILANRKDKDSVSLTKANVSKSYVVGKKGIQTSMELPNESNNDDVLIREVKEAMKQSKLITTRLNKALKRYIVEDMEDVCLSISTKYPKLLEDSPKYVSETLYKFQVGDFSFIKAEYITILNPLVSFSRANVPVKLIFESPDGIRFFKYSTTTKEYLLVQLSR